MTELLLVFALLAVLGALVFAFASRGGGDSDPVEAGSPPEDDRREKTEEG